MSRNEFRLRSVLRTRKRELGIARGRLASELRAKDRDQRDERNCIDRLHLASQRLHKRLAQGTTAAVLRPAEGAMDAAYAGAVEAGQRAHMRDAAIHDAREAVTTAHKRLRSLEILEEKWREQKRRERTKQDQKRLDEIAIQSNGGFS